MIKHEGWIIPTKKDEDLRRQQLLSKGNDPDVVEAFITREIEKGMLEFHMEKQGSGQEFGNSLTDKERKKIQDDADIDRAKQVKEWKELEDGLKKRFNIDN